MSAGIAPQKLVGSCKCSLLSEKASAQAPFIDLCRLLEQPTPADADTTGEE